MHFLFGFRGRMGRIGWWSGQIISGLFIFAGVVGSGYMLDLIATNRLPKATEFWSPNNPLGPLAGAVVLSLWVVLATAVKRLHDINRSGWTLLRRLVVTIVLWGLSFTYMTILTASERSAQVMDLMRQAMAHDADPDQVMAFYQALPPDMLAAMILPALPSAYLFLQLAFFPGTRGGNTYGLRRRRLTRAKTPKGVRPAAKEEAAQDAEFTQQARSAPETAQAAGERRQESWDEMDYLAMRQARLAAAPGRRKQFGRRGL